MSPFVAVPVWAIRRRAAARDCTARPWWSTCIARTRQRTIVGPHLTVACPRGACLCTGSGTSTGDRSLLESLMDAQLLRTQRIAQLLREKNAELDGLKAARKGAPPTHS